MSRPGLSSVTTTETQISLKPVPLACLVSTEISTLMETIFSSSRRNCWVRVILFVWTQRKPTTIKIRCLKDQGEEGKKEKKKKKKRPTHHPSFISPLWCISTTFSLKIVRFVLNYCRNIFSIFNNNLFLSHFHTQQEQATQIFTGINLHQLSFLSVPKWLYQITQKTRECHLSRGDFISLKCQHNCHKHSSPWWLGFFLAGKRERVGLSERQQEIVFYWRQVLWKCFS